MSTRNFKHKSSHREKLRAVRKVIRNNGTSDVKTIANKTGISEPHVGTLLRELASKGETRIVTSVKVSNFGKPRNIWGLTDSYLSKVKPDDSAVRDAPTKTEVKHRDTSELHITMSEPVRKPWYKRALSWLAGGSDLRTGA